MKTIEEMIATHTPEEWRKIIKDEMDELGLCFSEDTEYQKASLFEADAFEDHEATAVDGLTRINPEGGNYDE